MTPEKRRITKRAKCITKSPSWRDECVALLEQFIARDEEIARASYTEHRGHKRYFNQVIWRRADPVGFALVRKASKLIERARTLRVEIHRKGAPYE